MLFRHGPLALLAVRPVNLTSYLSPSGGEDEPLVSFPRVKRARNFLFNRLSMIPCSSVAPLVRRAAANDYRSRYLGFALWDSTINVSEISSAEL